MKSTNAPIRRLLLTIGCGLFSMTVFASGSPGYLNDKSGSVVTDSAGDCVKTGGWTSKLGTPACDAALAARLEAERLAAENALAAAKLAQLESPAAIKKPVLVRLSDARNVMFEFNSSSLNPSASNELVRVLNKIDEFDAIDSIEIIGHTDSTGPEQYNQALSVQRATGVRDYLAAHGIASRLLTVNGKGEISPVADNTSREGRAKNRRVDILIRGDKHEE
jgi:OOP family OmpA-OmpF porin